MRFTIRNSDSSVYSFESTPEGIREQKGQILQQLQTLVDSQWKSKTQRDYDVNLSADPRVKKFNSDLNFYAQCDQQIEVEQRLSQTAEAEKRVRDEQFRKTYGFYPDQYQVDEQSFY